MNLPKGNYIVELIWDELGFWKKRKWFHNKELLIIKTRSHWSDYLEDLFKFQKAETKHPFDSLGKYAFKPKVKEIKLSGGKLSFLFEGDPTGASLNSLMIYPVESKTEALRFKQKLFGFVCRGVKIKILKLKSQIRLMLNF